MKIPPQNISTSLNTIDTYVSNELVSKKIFNNLLDSLFQTNLVEAICVDSNADCQTIIGVKNNGLVAVEYSLLNRIKAIFGYGPLARVDLDKRKVSEYIASNWEQFSPNINSYSGLKKIKCLASHLKLSDVNSKVEPMYKCINELQEAGFGFKQAQKWFHLQKNIADSYNPKTQSFKAISNFYNCVQTDKKKSFFKLLKTLEDKEHPLREACFLTLSNHPDDADTVDLLEKLYSNSCFALLNLSEKLYVQSTISNDKYLYKQNIQIINKLFTDSLYSSWPKTQKNSVLQALKKYPLNASLIETLYMSAGFNLADEKYKSQLITLLEIKGNYFNEVSTLIEDLATNPDFSLSGSPQEINWLLSELINFLNDKNFLATKLTNVLDFIKKLYTDPDYSFLKKEVHMHCDPSHTNCGLNINLTHIASYYQKEIPLEELRLAYQDSHEFFNLEMILRSVNNGPVSYSKFMEMKPDLEPLLTKREKSDDEEKPTIKDNYMLAYYFQDISASVRKETCRLLSEIFTPSVIKKLPEGFESAWVFEFQFRTLDAPLYKILPYLKDFMHKSEDYIVQDATVANLQWNNSGLFLEKVAQWDRSDAFSALVRKFASAYYCWMNLALRDLKKDQKFEAEVEWSGEAWSCEQASKTELKEAEQIVEKKMEALSSFLSQLKLFRNVKEKQENGEMKVIETGFPSDLFIKIIDKNKIIDIDLDSLKNLSDPNNQILKNVKEEWSKDFNPPSSQKSAPSKNS